MNSCQALVHNRMIAGYLSPQCSARSSSAARAAASVGAAKDRSEIVFECVPVLTSREPKGVADQMHDARLYRRGRPDVLDDLR